MSITADLAVSHLPDGQPDKQEFSWLLFCNRFELIPSAAVKDSAAIFLIKAVGLKKSAPNFNPADVPLIFSFGDGKPTLEVAETGEVGFRLNSTSDLEPVTWLTSST